MVDLQVKSLANISSGPPSDAAMEEVKTSMSMSPNRSSRSIRAAWNSGRTLMRDGCLVPHLAYSLP